MSVGAARCSNFGMKRSEKLRLITEKPDIRASENENDCQGEMWAMRTQRCERGRRSENKPEDLVDVTESDI